MPIVENHIHGIQCHKCGKSLLYGAKIYDSKGKIYCVKCWKQIQRGDKQP